MADVINLHLPVPEIDILTVFLGTNVSEAQRQTAATELLRRTNGRRLLKLPRIAGYQTEYLMDGCVRLISLHDPIEDEINERLDLAFEVNA